jgi:uncharacterized protein YbjT (DUF2867 family)
MSRVLVTGATGYIGGRLVPALLAEGHEVRCLARRPERLDGAPWRGEVEVVAGDVTDEDDLDRALADMDAAYYLVHMIGVGDDWQERDLRAASCFRDAAARAGVGRIVYLGGLGRAEDEPLSPHLESRQEVGRTLAEGPVPVTELRAAVIIGSGSASFEMLRHLVERLPAMVTPRWVSTRSQPIAIRDVLAYLVGVLDHEETAGEVYEIGGPDVLTYLEMMRAYADVAGLRRRLVVTVPLLTPRLSSLWIGLVTPLPTDLARPLVDSLVNEVTVGDDRLTRVIPLELTSYRRAVDLALRRVRDLDVATSWSGADRSASAADPVPTDPEWSGGDLLADVRTAHSAASPEQLFATVVRIGGETGWYSPAVLWRLRELVDMLVGGPGIGRGRRHPDELHVGDAVDAWRVDRLEPGRLLRLRAEMRLPGSAYLEWLVEPAGAGSRLVQRALFRPRGLLGRAYWYALAPFHAVIFGRMVRRVADAGLADHGRGDPPGLTS